MGQRIRVIYYAFICIGLLIPICQSTVWAQSNQLLASNGGAFDSFGSSVAVSTDYALIGAPRENTIGVFSGAAYLFKWVDNTWVEETMLNSNTGRFFGAAVALSKEYAVVGAPGEQAAYLYTLNDGVWVADTTLQAGGRFGTALHIANDRIFIGATGSHESGAVYVYRDTGRAWVEEAVITAPEPVSDGSFGHVLATDEGQLIIGAPGANVAYVFEYIDQQWVETAALRPARTSGGEQFGYSIAASGGHILIGSPSDNTKASRNGAVYFFHKSEEVWMLQSVITPATATFAFGQAVALMNDQAFIKSGQSGGVHVFEYKQNQWVERVVLQSPDGFPGDGVGRSIAVQDSTVWMGAPADSQNGSDAGAVYLFDLPEVLASVQWAIYGSIENDDQDGLALVTVTLLNSDTTRITQTTLDGDFSFAFLKPDIYTLSVARQGYRCIPETRTLSLASDHIAEDFSCIFDPTLGPSWLASSKLTAPSSIDPPVSFGKVVALTDEYALVTAHGQVYGYERSGEEWEFHSTLLSAPLRRGFVFGQTAALWGNYALIGSLSPASSGPTYEPIQVFQRTGDTWTLTAMLAPPSNGPSVAFGLSLALWDDIAAVGVLGGVYVFKRSSTNWELEGTLTASNGHINDAFGFSLALWEETLLVGARAHNGGTQQEGAAYVFNRNEGAWTESAILGPSGDGVSARFGGSVALRENYALIGAIGEGPMGLLSGAAYIFRHNGGTWIEDTRLIASNGEAYDQFGDQVALSKEYAIVTTPIKTILRQQEGAAYMFRRTDETWMEEGMITVADSEIGSRFGSSVSASESAVLVGGPDLAPNGAVFVYNLGARSPFTGCVGDGTDTFILSLPASIQPTFDGILLEEGDEIAVLATSEQCVGRVVWTGSGATLAVSGDDLQTPEVEGLQPGELFEFRVWQQATGRIARASAQFSQGQPTYQAGETYTLASLEARSDGIFVATQHSTEFPKHIVAHGNYPNPFNQQTTIVFDMPEDGHVLIKVHDILGRLVLQTSPRNVPAGYRREFRLDPSTLASGLYMYQIQIHGSTKIVSPSTPMVVLK